MMNTLGRWKLALEEQRAERIRERARTADDAEAARAKQRALEAAAVRRIPTGLELRLEPTDWLEIVAPDVDRRPVVVVSTTHPPIMYRDDVGYLRIWGHTPRCGGQPDHGPCITLMCRVGAIIDAMDQQ
ncbi:hypothetical protein ACN28C_03205 [Plantactinospora sp. WMMC1484]|uniref:hypothetical protein n=1 Tax=Plantactinospora sp. WMMC1484 TaxID=3404122 RepID=UPI003BF58D0E